MAGAFWGAGGESVVVEFFVRVVVAVHESSVDRIPARWWYYHGVAVMLPAKEVRGDGECRCRESRMPRRVQAIL